MPIHTNDYAPWILLTGATGGLGSELLPRLLRRYPERTIVVLIRGRDEFDVQLRFAEIAVYSGLTDSERRRVTIYCADVSAPRFGLTESDYLNLAMNTSTIFHLAANIDFDIPLEVSRRANVNSTREMLAFAALAAGQGHLDRINYVSTAFVAGDRRCLLLESELRRGQGFWNVYEHTKLEAEELVQEAKSELPVTIYRPSLIVGDSTTGRIRKFFGFYEFLKLALRGKLRVLPADQDARMDLVPTDYVCKAMLYLNDLPAAAGRTFHLAAGLERSFTVRQLVDFIYLLSLETNIIKNPVRPHIVRHDLLSAQADNLQARAYRNSALYLLMKSYLPYLTYERNFDVAATQRLLENAGIVMAPISDVLRITTIYAAQHGITDVQRESLKRTTSLVAPERKA